MNEVICKCGYKGCQMVEFETETPYKRLVEWQYGSGYYNFINWVKQGTKTLNWACPKCGKILVQQRGGLSYNQSELDGMRRRLMHSSWDNEMWLKVHSQETTMGDFKHGDKVRYIPNHANGDPTHSDCQNGVVSSVNDNWVFVKYDCLACTMITGDEPYTAKPLNEKI